MTVIQSLDTQSNVIQQFQSLIGSAHVTAGDDLDQPLRDRLSTAIAPQAPLPCIVYPNTQEELADVVACAAQHGWRLLPIGSGSKVHWGGLAHTIHALVSTTRLNRLIDHAVGDLTITAESGMRFRTLTDTLQHAQQHLGIDPTYVDQATIGGIVATGDTGALRQRYGGVRDRLIGLSLVRADGTVAKAGGRVVKNVAGYDLMKLMTGAYGTLGILSQLTFRVYPKAETSQTVVLVGDGPAIQSLTAAVLASSLTPHRFDVLSPVFVHALGLGNGVGLVVQFESIAISVEQQVKQLSAMATALTVTIEDCRQQESESALWKQLQDVIEHPGNNVPITCKIGVLPNQVIPAIQQLPHLLPTAAIARIHASSGLGQVQFDGAAIAPTAILPLRRWCESQNGFLTILEAPLNWKQQLDVWGYSGNSLSVMQKLKEQFDPQHVLNPGRFVGSI
ncbi:MAG: FAD-binding oxidoreductase [Cyanobacteria bacterium P01_A01_bin.37]